MEKCKKCGCNAKRSEGLADKIGKYRPAERVVEREIVELATRCEDCNCDKEVENA